MTMEEAICGMQGMRASAVEYGDKNGIEMIDMAISALMFTEKIAKLHNCNDCRIKYICPHSPNWGDTVRYNCFRWRGEQPLPEP